MVLIQSNPTVGDLDANVGALIALIDGVRTALSCGASPEDGGANAPLLFATGELAVTGYPPEDLLLRPAFLDAVEAAVRRLAQAARGVDVVIGAPWRTASVQTPATQAADAARGQAMTGALDARPDTTEDLYNAALWLRDGDVHAVYAKRLLPNYAVFDERRYFVAGQTSTIVEWCGNRVALAVCEDVWAPQPLADARQAGADWCLSLHASPWHRDKRAEREAVLLARVHETGFPVVYVNLVGGQDELVFDGRSCVAIPAPQARRPAAGGGRGADLGDEGSGAAVLPVLPAWRPGVAVLDGIDRWAVDPASLTARVLALDAADDPTSGVRARDGSGRVANARREAAGAAVVGFDREPESELWAALKLGLGDYARKNGFDTAVLGLSGGIDSAVVAALAAEVFGPERVTALMLPYRYTSQQSLDLAAALAEGLGLAYHVVDLVAPVETTEAALTAALDTLPADRVTPRNRALMHENLQSRLRGNVLMGWSNATGALLLACGNKSEMTVGYATLYGDMAGGFAPLKDVTKTWVYRLARAYNARAQALGRAGIPAAIVERPPSAELAPGQLDRDSLPEYDLLDRLIEAMVEQDRGVEALIHEGFPEPAVRQLARLLRLAEYKRRQSAPGVRVTRRAFGRDRRYPITSRFLG